MERLAGPVAWCLLKFYKIFPPCQTVSRKVVWVGRPGCGCRGVWNQLAEVHGNRTHLPPSADGTPDLKSGGPTSEPRTSAATNASDVSGSATGWRACRRYPIITVSYTHLRAHET